MSFFNDLGKKISDASQGAVAKTKDFTDVKKLNMAIREEERKVEDGYIVLGKAYFDAHKENGDDSFKDQIATIEESLNKIKKLERQIGEIKGIRKCPNCGLEVTKEAAFCSACGTAIPVPEPVEEAVEETVEEVAEETVEGTAEEAVEEAEEITETITEVEPVEDDEDDEWHKGC